MIARTFEYGATRRATVEDVIIDRSGHCVVIAVDELGEGHAIVGDSAPAPSKGDVGEVVFLQGGPNGGYWSFRRGGQPCQS